MLTTLALTVVKPDAPTVMESESEKPASGLMYDVTATKYTAEPTTAREMVRMGPMMVLTPLLLYDTAEFVGERSVRIKRETYFRGPSSLPLVCQPTWGIICRRADSWSGVRDGRRGK